MRFVIHRGADTIGGSCVEVTSKDSRIIIDVGLPLGDLQGDDDTLRPETAFPATDRRALPIPGLFQPGPPVAGILLSHAHVDHCGLICQTDPSIKVYTSKGTSKMMKAGSIFAGQHELSRKRQVEVKAQVPVQIGDFKVTPFNVDHSAFDAMAFLIEADGQRLLYTGDFRLHGPKPGMANALVEAAASPQVDVMLLEGTNFNPQSPPSGPRRTERHLWAELAERVAAAPGLLLASLSPQNVDRLVGYYKAARKANRTFVADIYTAFVLYLVHSQCRSIPGPTSSAGIRVYYNRGFTRKGNWKHVVSKFPHSEITLEEIRQNPKQFVMVFRPPMLALDFHNALPAESTCLYSMWHGYLERREWKRCRDTLTRNGCSFAEYHTSGHVFVDDCQKFVQHIKPRSVVPVHTLVPALFQQLFESARPTSNGTAFVITP